MAGFSAKQTRDLNRANRANQNVQLGTIIGNLAIAGSLISGSHLVTSGEASASRVVITTGLSSVTSFFPTYTRSGSHLGMTWASGSVAGTLIASNSTSASPLANDIASFIAF